MADTPPRREPAQAQANGKSPVENARELVQIVGQIEELETQLIGLYQRLGEVGQKLAQIGADRA